MMQANNGDVFYYRDKDELEADLIVRLRDGHWAAGKLKQLPLTLQNSKRKSM